MQYKAASALPLQVRRGLLCDLVNQKRTAALASGLVFDGHRYDTDPTSLQNLTATVAALSAGIPLPAPFFWRTADNELVPHTAESVTLLAASALQFVNTTYAASWALKDAINASETPETIDISEGWP